MNINAESFVKAESENIEERIRKNVENWLANQ